MHEKRTFPEHITPPSQPQSTLHLHPHRHTHFNPLPKKRLQKCSIAKYILRDLVKENRKWEIVSLDPPKLAPNKRDLDKALKAYKDIILNGIKLTNKGGLLAIYSCSGAVTSNDLRMALAYAVKDAGVKATIIHQLHQSSCHPISVSVPETEYLKGFLVRII